MERHKCKLCMRSFSNGRALGGHMRSHMMNLPIHQNPQGEEEDAPVHDQMLIDEIDSVSASSSSDDEEGHGEEEEEDEEGLYYGLRENPKRSIRLVDPEFSFAVESGSVVLQDRESETESSKNPTRRRSKRTRKSAMFDHLQHHDHQQLHNQYHHHHPKLNQHHQEAFNKIKLKNKIDSYANNNVEPEPVSSISDATTEEDVAFCLMMLSRDKWKKQDKQQQEEQDYQDEDVEVEYRSLDESDESEEQLIKFQRTKSSRGKYKCETCNKVFKSYQALGGHRASHKKIKAASAANPNPNRIVYKPEPDPEINHNAGSSSFVKTHECPVCFRVFSSGQALGGHKRSHVTGSAAINYTHHHTPSMKSLAKLGDNMIDLNLPAPVDDDEMSQIELSAVSDAEFVNPIRR
ncbi:PREDICTED: zinc finger protein ZAT9 [Fragaria vesca subsp. vesca]|uniref:zinc finger protein ZAT9 n=1 Tax=Fragaria vesca subsp. vesca TaxID=101020 RepID=UPI0002C2F0FD|nr:PREDICTED: zinc finger protein ZAT9 [Fragaria vesca subsp. vesca]